MKKTSALYAVWILLFFVIEAVWSISLLSIATLIVQARFGTVDSLWLFSLICVAAASYVLLVFFAHMLRWSGQDKMYQRFRSLYWLYAFVTLTLAVFFSAYVLPHFHFVSFVPGKGFDYVASYLIFAILGGVLPRILLPKTKEGGVVDGGNI